MIGQLILAFVLILSGPALGLCVCRFYIWPAFFGEGGMFPYPVSNSGCSAGYGDLVSLFVLAICVFCVLLGLTMSSWLTWRLTKFWQR